MPRNTIARIDTGAILYNYRLACQQAGTARAMAVIKAGGYGHGIRQVARALANDAPKYAVASLEEALEIRQEGLRHPVVLLQGVHARDDIDLCAEQGFELVLHSDYQVEWLAAARAVPPVWLKVNTGMNRLGFAPGRIPDVVAGVEAMPSMKGRLQGFVTHFACADDLESQWTAEQTRVFDEVVGPWPNLQKSVGNSAAHFLPDQPLYDWSRPGIMLFGSSPILNTLGPELGLRPAMTLEAEITAVRILKAGDCVGYGAAWVADRETPMGIVAIGYGDGYPRHAGTGTPAWVNGQRIRLIGRVSMDMLAVDLSNAPGTRPGDRVELWGPNVSVDEVARHSGTIAYELLTGITARVPRLYGQGESSA